MSQQKQTIKLTQEQSAVLDGLQGWRDTGKTINYNDKITGEPKSFWLKFQEKALDASTLEAINIFGKLGLSLYDKVESYSGVFIYTLGKDTIEKQKSRKSGDSSPAQTTQFIRPPAGTSIAKNPYDERQLSITKQHDENIAAWTRQAVAQENANVLKAQEIEAIKEQTRERSVTNSHLEEICFQLRDYFQNSNRVKGTEQK